MWFESPKRPKLRKTTCLILLGFGVLPVSLGTACALIGAWWTLPFCAAPGANCGASGHLLYTAALSDGLAEVSPRLGAGWFTGSHQGSAALSYGFAFSQTEDGLRLFVATTGGLYEFDGRVSEVLYNVVTVPGCETMQDVVVLEDGDVVASCPTEGRLVRIDPSLGDVVESFACCDEVEEPFVPLSLALSPDGSVLAGTSQIIVFDGETGALIRVAVENGVNGASQYDDFEFGPNGNLFVSANPNVGVLEFDGVTFDFLRVFVPGGEDGVQTPTGLAFSPDGNLLVISSPDRILEFDGVTGEFVEEVLSSPGFNERNPLLFIGFRP